MPAQHHVYYRPAAVAARFRRRPDCSLLRKRCGCPAPFRVVGAANEPLSRLVGANHSELPLPAHWAVSQDRPCEGAIGDRTTHPAGDFTFVQPYLANLIQQSRERLLEEV